MLAHCRRRAFRVTRRQSLVDLAMMLGRLRQRARRAVAEPATRLLPPARRIHEPVEDAVAGRAADLHVELKIELEIAIGIVLMRRHGVKTIAETGKARIRKRLRGLRGDGRLEDEARLVQFLEQFVDMWRGQPFDEQRAHIVPLVRGPHNDAPPLGDVDHVERAQDLQSLPRDRARYTELDADLHFRRREAVQQFASGDPADQHAGDLLRQRTELDLHRLSL